MYYTDFMQRVEALMQETGCTYDMAVRACSANDMQPARSEITKGQRVLCRARSLMRNRGIGWSRAIDLAAQTVE